MTTVGPLLDKMTVVTVDPQERARILSIMYVTVIVLTSPFGWIAGTLSSMDRVLPFLLSMALFGVGAFLTWRAARLSEFSQSTGRLTSRSPGRHFDQQWKPDGKRVET